MSYRILDSVWFTNTTLVRSFFGSTNTAQIGIVAVKTNEHEPDDVLEWKAYVGVGYTEKEISEQSIAKFGTPLTAQQAWGFFLNLDINKYKKW